MKSDSKQHGGASLPASAGSAFDHARLNDPTVAVMLEMGKPLEAIIGQLYSEKKQYLKRIVELESIAPRKIVLPDGRVMVWRCPDAFIHDMPNAEVSDGSGS